MADDATPRERWTAILEGKRSDRPPMDYWATEEVTDILMRYFKAVSLRDLYQKLDIDVPIKVEPKYVGPPIPLDEDVFGCKYRDVDYGTGSYREISPP
jgi:uroporphyrinogen decarboxylase